MIRQETELNYASLVDELSKILTEIPPRSGVRLPLRPRPKKLLPIVLPPPLPPPPQRPAQLQHAIDSKLMTFEQLKQKVGHAPKKDLFGGKFKMSSRYKAMGKAVDDSQQEITGLEQRPASDLLASRDALEQAVMDQLDIMISRAETYRDKKKGGKKKPAQDLIDNAKQYKADLTANLDKVLADPEFARIANSATIGEVLATKMRGLNFADCKFDVHNDTKLDVQKSKDGFGSGAVNSVSKLVHQDGKERIFKPEPLDDPGIKKGPRLAGIDPTAPHYGNRNVASKISSDVLGLSVMPEASFATHNGQVGLMMSKAEGNSPRQKVWEDYDQESAEREFESNRKQMGLEKRDGVWKKGVEKMVKPWATPPSENAQASMQEQLNGLEWTDMLSGQVDRHSANYFIDIKGDDVKVTGIDNDFCFGKDQEGLLKYDTGKGITSPGQPKLLDSKTFARLDGLDFDRDMLPKLTGLLSDEEIAASRKRITAVVVLARQLNTAGLVVDNWKTWRSPSTAVPPDVSASAYLAAQEGPSLFKRDFAKFFREDGLLA